MIDSPKVSLTPNGIVEIDFGNLLITVELLADALRQQQALAPGKSKVLMIGEAGAKIDTDLAQFSSSDSVVAHTHAAALVPRGKVGRVLANLFLRLHKNPFPTRAFDDPSRAREWLLSLKLETDL
ncbi:MAG: hypothetical protein HOK21_04865 [Rhodospirillaceae bacterium]|jgi:hypothetical protein|nr:hypothetical protein [Rhodospirillaceae bacterium]MBT4045796.1 hypothetical protein [Rhodospirillaceae bacterium]MBT4688674.1 hypothetical protein [Rhodospirillaceae bacterium]MBT5078976.1 hypothetical protein [Rhodospirillaceae bacterium]MBT5523395.1 hypothetical protein [Rhodospirillaceae bacterium]